MNPTSIIKKAGAGLLATLLACSCDEGQMPLQKPVYAIALSADTLYSRARGDTAVFVVRSVADSLPAPFAVSSKPNWVSVQAIDDTTLQVVFDSNPVKAARSGAIVLSQQAAGGQTASLILEQNALVTRPVWKRSNIQSDAMTNCISYVDGDPNTVFYIAGSGEGVSLYKSTDGGKNWHFVRDQMGYASLTSVLFHWEEKWMHWSSPTQGTIVLLNSHLAPSYWHILKTSDGGLTWGERVTKDSRLRTMTIPATDKQPAFITTEIYDHPMINMLISPDRNWNTALQIVWRDRFDNSGTGYAARDYTYVGCNNGELWRVATADLFQTAATQLDPTGLSMTRFDITLPDNAGTSFIRALQEAGGALYCIAQTADGEKRYIMKSADKGENWTVYAEIPEGRENGSDRPFRLKVFEDGSAVAVGYNHIYTFTPKGEIDLDMPPPEGFTDYFTSRSSFNHTNATIFAAYDTRRMIFALHAPPFYLGEEAVKEEENPIESPD